MPIYQNGYINPKNARGSWTNSILRNHFKYKLQLFLPIQLLLYMTYINNILTIEVFWVIICINTMLDLISRCPRSCILTISMGLFMQTKSKKGPSFCCHSVRPDAAKMRDCYLSYSRISYNSNDSIFLVLAYWEVFYFWC